jgi:hypothetical protein
MAQAKKTEPEASKLHTTQTLEAVGRTLPVGLNGNRSLEFREWTAEEELMMSESVGRDSRQNRYCEVVLATMCSKFGPLEVWRGNERLIPEQDFTLRLREAYGVDVIYAYVFLRREVLGKTAYMEVSDPWTREMIRWPANLDTLEINIPKDPGVLTWRYDFVTPCMLLGTKVTHFMMGPSRWGAMGNLESGNSDLELIASHVHAIPELGERMNVMTSDLLAKMRMSRIDIAMCSGRVNSEQFGPQLIGEGKSTKSGKAFYFPIDFRHKHFFGASSLLPP